MGKTSTIPVALDSLPVLVARWAFLPFRKPTEKRRSLDSYRTFLAVLRDDKEREGAVEAFSRVVDLGCDLAYRDSGPTLRERGREGRAAEDFERALDADLPHRARSAAGRRFEELRGER